MEDRTLPKAKGKVVLPSHTAWSFPCRTGIHESVVWNPLSAREGLLLVASALGGTLLGLLCC